MDSFISKLVDDLETPSPSQNWFAHYWGSWTGCILLMGGLTMWAAAIVPKDIHLPENLTGVSFWLETACWFALALISGVIGYLSAQPARKTSGFLILNYGIAIVLGISLVLRETPSTFASEFTNELHWHRGPCGMFILASGAVASLWMFTVLKRAAPTRLSFTGLWVAVSVGSAMSMLMHLVCTRETTAHAIIWHIAPLMVLSMVGMAASRRSFRW
jgi:hypothetical protein